MIIDDVSFDTNCVFLEGGEEDKKKKKKKKNKKPSTGNKKN